jgi:type III secretion system YscI/HrpB-like protein
MIMLGQRRQSVEVNAAATKTLTEFTTSQSSVKPRAGAAMPETSPDAVARLEQALAGTGGNRTPDGQGLAVGAKSSSPAASQDAHEFQSALSPAPVAQASPGDAILKSLDRMSQGFTKSVDGLTSGLATNPAELLKFQMHFQEVTFQQDLVAKVASKATNTVDTFLKNQ